MPIVFPPHDSGASPVTDEEIMLAAAIVPAPIPIMARGARGALLVRICCNSSNVAGVDARYTFVVVDNVVVVGVIVVVVVVVADFWMA